MNKLVLAVGLSFLWGNIVAQDLHIYLNSNNCNQHAAHLSVLDQLPSNVHTSIVLRTTERKAARRLVQRMGAKDSSNVNLLFAGEDEFRKGLGYFGISAFHLILGKDTTMSDLLDSLSANLPRISAMVSALPDRAQFELTDTVPFTKRIEVVIANGHYYILDKLLFQLAVIPAGDSIRPTTRTDIVLCDMDSLWSRIWHLEKELSKSFGRDQIDVPQFYEPISLSATQDGAVIAIRFSVTENTLTDNGGEYIPPYYLLMRVAADLQVEMLGVLDQSEWADQGYVPLLDLGNFRIDNGRLVAGIIKDEDPGAMDGLFAVVHKDPESVWFMAPDFKLFTNHGPMWNDGFQYALCNALFSRGAGFMRSYPLYIDTETGAYYDLSQTIGATTPFFGFGVLRYHVRSCNCDSEGCTLSYRLDGQERIAKFRRYDPLNTWEAAPMFIDNRELDISYTMASSGVNVWVLDKSWSKLVRLNYDGVLK